MKKIFLSIIAFILIISASLSTAGCSLANGGIFYEKADNNQNKNTPTNYTAEVSVGVGEENNENLLSLINALKKVERTSVALSTNDGVGSGVIIDIDYSEPSNDKIIYVITCHHMISGKGDIEVIIPDEDCKYDNLDYTFTGKIGAEIYTNQAVTLVGGDKDTDIALIKINLDLPAKSGNKLSIDKIVKASLPSSTYYFSKGEEVFAVGNPSGECPGTFSHGYISYLERETTVEDVGTMLLTQIDVATNPGSSGGGLYNLYGELIGITNAGNTDYTNINFAIPFVLSNGNGFINIASKLLGSATEENYGYVAGTKEKFGFTASQTTGTDESTYVYISDITSGSIASNSGLKVNDIINKAKINDGEYVTITTIKDFSGVISLLTIGDTINIEITRTSTIGWGRYQQETKNIEMTARQFWFCDTGR